MDDYTRDWDEVTGAAKQSGEKCFPRFYIEPVQDHYMSEKLGRPVFNDREFVEIIIAGDRTTKPVCVVTDEHRHRWPRHYAAFKAGQEPPVDGMPLEQWPAMSKSMVMELKASGFRTVEQIANLADDAPVRDAQGLKKRAQKWLNSQKENVDLKAENDELKKRMSEIEARLAAFSMPSEKQGKAKAA